ncbi:MAG: thiol:disulfide interchange protein DsbA/DsbL [Pseudomonadota bacterium]
MYKLWLLTSMVLWVAFGAGAAIAAGPKAIEGKHYLLVNPAAEAKEPLVTEFFSYGCPHCYSMETQLAQWKKTKNPAIQFQRVPVIFNKSWELLAEAYYAAESLGVLEDVHTLLFHRIHVEKRQPTNYDQLAEVFKKADVGKEWMVKAINSFAVKNKIKRAKKLTAKFKIDGVPSFVINDKYLVSGGTAGTKDMLMHMLSDLPLTTLKAANAPAAVKPVPAKSE